MRYIILITFLISTSLFSQDALKIKYGKQNIFELNPEGIQKAPELAEQLIKAMNEVKDYEMILYNNEAEYNFKEKINNQQTGIDGKGIRLTIRSSGEKRYSNYNTNVHLELSNINGKSKIIKGELPVYDWELTRETKEILGLKVRKAITTTNQGEVVAWYAPEIPYKAGPEDIWGLPGLILEYEVTTIGKRKTKNHIFAQEIIHLDANKVKINKLDDSNAISKEEHQEAMQKDYERTKGFYSEQGVDVSD